jgi:hypothetical protein
VEDEESLSPILPLMGAEVKRTNCQVSNDVDDDDSFSEQVPASMWAANSNSFFLCSKIDK